jgi:hypothetical protein
LNKAWIFALTVFAATPRVFGQDGAPAIKAEAISAFVWGQDSSSGAVSSTIQDPLTGNVIRRLSYAGIEVSSRIGFERTGTDQTGTFLNYATTIVNGTDEIALVRYGGIRVDGQLTSPLSVAPAGRKAGKKELKSDRDVVEIGKIHCLTSGFLSGDNWFSADASSQVLTVVPRTALTVSSIVRDPRRYHAVLCSVDGCYPTGTIRYYLTVNSRDYVFVWPGRYAVYCGG